MAKIVGQWKRWLSEWCVSKVRIFSAVAPSLHLFKLALNQRSSCYIHCAGTSRVSGKVPVNESALIGQTVYENPNIDKANESLGPGNEMAVGGDGETGAFLLCSRLSRKVATLAQICVTPINAVISMGQPNTPAQTNIALKTKAKNAC